MSWRYAPDLPPDTPNTWTVCDGFHPDMHGVYRTGWLAGSALATPPTTAEARGYQLAFAYQTAAGSAQTVMAVRYTSGTPVGRVLVYNGSGWNARTGTADFPTFFAQLGNYTLAVGGLTPGISYRDATGTSNFASASGPTTVYRAICVTAQNIAVVIGEGNDEWATSDVGDPTNFSTGEAASGNLRQASGVGTAIVAFGNDAIAFKSKGVFRGQYVGGAIKWAWTLVDTEKGTWGENCAVYGDGKVYFIGNAGAYSYDGNTFERIDYGLWRVILSTLAATDAAGSGAQHVKAIWDSVSRRLFLFRLGGQSVASAGTRTTTANAFFTYEPASGKWGYQSLLTNAGTEKFSAVCDGSVYNTYAASGTAGPTYNTNIMFFSETNDVFKFLTSTFTAGALTDYQPKIRTHRLGNRLAQTLVTRFVPGWTISDGIGTDLSSATLKSAIPYISDSVNEAESANATATLSTDLYRADIGQSRNFHSIELRINCEAALDGGEWDVPKAAGKR
jgi:hypothetical protein